jgi:hypothetical protein
MDGVASIVDEMREGKGLKQDREVCVIEGKRSAIVLVN